jgi:hypothetical protein
MKCIKCNQETGADWKTLCYSCYKNRSTEEVREARQKKLDRKIQRLRSKAERLKKIAEEKQAELNRYRGDIAFITQPASKSSAFGRRRQKIHGRYDAGIKLLAEASDLRKKADWLEKQGAIVKGDAERKRQALREELDKVISVGTSVNDYIFGAGEVMRVNKKTYTIRFESGGTYAREKVYVRLLKEE